MTEALTDQQKKWMASVRAGLEAKTGKTLAEWVEIARTCPETKPRARQAWFKEVHGLGQNHAMLVIHATDSAEGGPASPTAERDALWSNPAQLSILQALEAAVAGYPALVSGQRKGFTSWSRAYAFAAARPVKAGGVRLGLVVEPGADPRLAAPKNEGWSERLKSVLVLASPEDVDAGVRALLQASWEKS